MTQQNFHWNQIIDQRKTIQGGYWDTGDVPIIVLLTINNFCYSLMSKWNKDLKGSILAFNQSGQKNEAMLKKFSFLNNDEPQH